ncbi:MAG: DUF4129 domain-containing protein [Anaerolineales bacterium]
MPRWNWLEDWLLPPAVAVLNSAWLGLWVLWSVRAVPAEISAPPISPVVLWLLFLGAAILTRRLVYADEPGLNPRFALAGLGVLAVFAATWLTHGALNLPSYFAALVDWGDFISPVFVGVLACAFMWWRGIVLGRSQLPHENLERAFYGGIGAMAMLFAANQYRPLIAPSEALLAALTFFATGLGSLSLVSITRARRLEESETGHWPALNRYWLGTVAGVIGSILLGGLLAASLLSPATFAQLNQAFEFLVNILTVAFVVYVGTLVFLMTWLLQPLIARLAEALSGSPLRLFAAPNWEQTAEVTQDYFDRYPVLNFVRQGLVLLAIAGGLALIFWWAVRRFNRLTRKDTDETRDSIATRDLLLEQLLNLFRRKPPAAPPEPPFLALAGPRDDPRLMVRRAYQAMLEWALSLSLPARRAGQTPQAYAETIAQALPQGRPELDVLTRAYLAARYAGEAPSLEEARSAQGAVRQLQALAPAARRQGPTAAP